MEVVAGSAAWLGRGLSCVCAQRRDSDDRPSFDLTSAQVILCLIGFFFMFCFLFCKSVAGGLFTIFGLITYSDLVLFPLNDLVYLLPLSHHICGVT